MPKPRSTAALLLATMLLLVASGLPALAAPPALVRAPAAAPCTERVANGNFELGSRYWTEEGASGVKLVTNFDPRTGKYSADLGGVNSVNHRIKQQVWFPKAGTVTLTFWWEQWTQETAPTTQDYLAVALLNANGTLIKELARLGADPDMPPWEQLSFDLSAYGGKPLLLQFQAVTDNVNPTEFFVDDVSVAAPATRCSYLPFIRR